MTIRKRVARGRPQSPLTALRIRARDLGLAGVPYYQARQMLREQAEMTGAAWDADMAVTCRQAFKRGLDSRMGTRGSKAERERAERGSDQVDPQTGAAVVACRSRPRATGHYCDPDVILPNADDQVGDAS